MILRPVTTDDIPKIMEMLMEMYEENAHFLINVASVEKFARTAIADSLCLGLEKDGELIGSTGMFTTNAWYSDVRYLTDYWFFIREKHRDIRSATLLLNGAKTVARALGHPLVIGVFSKSEPERKTKFFSRAMTPIGGFFLHEAV